MSSNPVKVILYRWAGAWGPLRVNTPSGECSLTVDVIKDTFSNELADIPVELETHDWLSKWWRPLIFGGWHAPIVIVGNRVVSQGHALNRGVLTEAVIGEYVKSTELSSTHLFGKENCPHCVRAKGYLEKAHIDYEYHDVIKEPRSLYEMLGRVKPVVGSKTPITVPQIWFKGEYVGGANELQDIVKRPIKANPDRGQCSLSPAGNIIT